MNAREVQLTLRKAGYDPGPIDGIPGPRTKAAMAAFLRDYGLPSDAFKRRGFWERLAGNAIRQMDGTERRVWQALQMVNNPTRSGASSSAKAAGGGGLAAGAAGGASSSAKAAGGGGLAAGGGFSGASSSAKAAGGGGGLSSSRAASGGDRSQMSTEDRIAVAHAEYGAFSFYFDHADIGPLLNKAVDKGWTPSKLQTAIAQTAWWKNTSTSVRAWDALERSDPAEARRRADQLITQLRVQATNAGIELSYDQARDIALTSLAHGWDQTQIDRSLELAFRAQDPSTPLQGDAANLALQYREMARGYAVPIDDETIRNFVANDISGRGDIDNVRSYLIEMAKSKYPYLAEQLDAGLTVRDYFNPYVNRIAQILERTPDSIELNDPKFSRVFSGEIDQSGNHRALSLWETEQYVRGLPEYEMTRGARDQAFETVQQLGRTFGFA